MTRSFLKRKNEQGAAAVEFAFVLPILLLLVFGIIEFGLVFNRYISVTHAAREGVRVYALTDDVLTGETAGEAASPDLVTDPIDCVAVPAVAPSTQVSMTCSTSYNFALFVIAGPLGLNSTATMTSE